MVVIDDGSTDGTGELLESFEDSRCIKVAHAKNLGKGAAVRTGIASAKGLARRSFRRLSSTRANAEREASR